jgi:hypothetical protein
VATNQLIRLKVVLLPKIIVYYSLKRQNYFNATKNVNIIFYDLQFYSVGSRNVNEKSATVFLPLLSQFWTYVRSNNYEAAFQSFITESISIFTLDHFRFF